MKRSFAEEIDAILGYPPKPDFPTRSFATQGEARMYLQFEVLPEAYHIHFAVFLYRGETIVTVDPFAISYFRDMAKQGVGYRELRWQKLLRETLWGLVPVARPKPMHDEDSNLFVSNDDPPLDTQDFVFSK